MKPSPSVRRGLYIESEITASVDGEAIEHSRWKGSTMTVSVFIGTSVDGFIARPNGALDFLPDGGGEPHGYNEFMATVDALVIGRNTFETVLVFPEWPYGTKRVVVLSSRPLDLSAARGAVIEQMAGSPAEIISKLAASGAHNLYVDGGITIQRFLRAGLIQRLIITRVPVLIGEGIPLFGALPRDLRLHHVKTQHYPSGLVKTEYKIVNDPEITPRTTRL
jgi:dihydrofolate reductase